MQKKTRGIPVKSIKNAPYKAENISNTICRQVSDLAQLSDVLKFNGELESNTYVLQVMGSNFNKKCLTLLNYIGGASKH